MSFIKVLSITIRKHPTFRRLYYSFFFRLLMLDFKKNLLLLVFWSLLFGMITNNIAPNYGIAYLFLGPEYFNKISFLSYFIVGFSCGGFIMAYNIASFIQNAYRFPFLASLRFPFMKYCLNNFVIPLIFITLYCFEIYFFLRGEGIMPTAKILLMIVAFLSGIGFFLFLAFTYFFKGNKDIFKLYGIQHKIEIPYKADKKPITGERNPKLVKESRDWYVETYFSTPTSIRLVRSVQHYKKEMLKEVIRRNHHVAFIFQMISIVSLLVLGFFGEINTFEIPAGASLFLLFTAFSMLFSSFYRWWGGWSIPVFILFLFLFNFVHKIDLLTVDRAYGLNYNTKKADYSYENFKKVDKDYELFDKDIVNMLGILNKWKQKNTSSNDPLKKPKLVFINTSGGGLRSSLWTFYTLQYADSLLNGRLLQQTQLITGSSGGMIGAAYLRELYLQKQKNKIESYYHKKYLTNISNDVLNPIAFKIATSEWLFPMQSFTLDGSRYPKDRAYAFEHRLEENTDKAFNKRLSDYQLQEANSSIPMMIFSPSIVNDGRKLMISTQPISFLTQNTRTNKTSYNKLFDAIEYSRFFEEQDASKIVFSSILRMSATFPYISPVVSLPSEPRIEIMDAGLRDNFGLETTLRFIKTFNDWIAENTSGIVIIQIRDKHKNSPIEENPSQTLMQALTRPMGSFYGNLFDVQDYNQNALIQMADIWCKSKIEFIDLQLRNEKNDHISLSWHLTNKEKKKVFASVFLPENQDAIKRIVELLK
jgi:hypothetical protein